MQSTHNSHLIKALIKLFGVFIAIVTVLSQISQYLILMMRKYKIIVKQFVMIIFVLKQQTC